MMVLLLPARPAEFTSRRAPRTPSLAAPNFGCDDVDATGSSFNIVPSGLGRARCISRYSVRPDHSV